MRHPRLTTRPPLIAVAHGSKDALAAATVHKLLSVVRAQAAARGLAGLDVKAAFLDHCAPSLPQALGSVADPAGCVVVPLLLTAAYHSKTDIPAQLASVSSALPRLDVRYARTLGPHPLLLAALDRRLRETGSFARAETSVVLAAAGSGDPSANAAVAALARRMQTAGGWRRVVPAYASAASPSPGEAVLSLRSEGPVLVATYLLAPGYFADRIRDTALAAGACGVSAVLGDAPEVADVIMDRYEAAVRAELSVPLTARAQLYPERDHGDLSVNQLITGSIRGNLTGDHTRTPCARALS